MKIFLDSERDAPEGWMAVRWPEEVILLLATGEVTDLSFGHEFGRGLRGTPEQVLDWLAEAVTKRGFTLPTLAVHTTNSTAKAKLEARCAQVRQLTPGAPLPAAEKKEGAAKKPRPMPPPTGLSMIVPHPETVCESFRAHAEERIAKFPLDEQQLAAYREAVAWSEEMFRKYWFYRLGTNYGSEAPSRMNDGFMIGRGWRVIVEQLSQRLQQQLGEPQQAAVLLEVVSVREKAGRLLFFYRLYNRFADADAYDRVALTVRALVDAAVDASTKFCEQCGQRGASIEQNGTVATLCPVCTTR
jgi:hypothetical protein